MAQRDNRLPFWVLGMHHPAGGPTRRCLVQPSTPLGPDQVNVSLLLRLTDGSICHHTDTEFNEVRDALALNMLVEPPVKYQGDAGRGTEINLQGTSCVFSTIGRGQVKSRWFVSSLALEQPRPSTGCSWTRIC
jgi:hypothetical protein